MVWLESQLGSQGLLYSDSIEVSLAWRSGDRFRHSAQFQMQWIKHPDCFTFYLDAGQKRLSASSCFVVKVAIFSATLIWVSVAEEVPTSFVADQSFFLHSSCVKPFKISKQQYRHKWYTVWLAKDKLNWCPDKIFTSYASQRGSATIDIAFATQIILLCLVIHPTSRHSTLRLFSPPIALKPPHCL